MDIIGHVNFTCLHFVRHIIPWLTRHPPPSPHSIPLRYPFHVSLAYAIAFKTFISHLCTTKCNLNNLSIASGDQVVHPSDSDLITKMLRQDNPSEQFTYSGKYPFSGLLFYASCGDILSRTYWNIHGRKQTVWRCSTRMQDGPDACHCRTIDEEMLKRITVNAINRAHLMSKDAADRAAECVDEALNESLLEQATAIDEKIKALQIELIGYRADSPDADRIGTEILTLRDEKEKILSQSALQAQRTNEIREIASFFEGLSGPLITFDGSYVRRLFTRITVYDDKVVFAFKDGKEVTIKE